MTMVGTEAGSSAEDPQDPQGAYAYPADLARFVRESWEDHAEVVDDPGYGSAEVPETPVLERLFSTCYQASLLREEERPVSFRAILAAPEDLPERGGPPEGLHRFEFGEPRPFDEHELRRLSPGADFERSLIGVRRSKSSNSGELEIWGLVHTGPRWLGVAPGGQGGRERSAPLPPVPVVRVEGPGRLAVNRGSGFVAELSGGKIAGSRADFFPSRWLQGYFTHMG